MDFTSLGFLTDPSLICFYPVLKGGGSNDDFR